MPKHIVEGIVAAQFTGTNISGSTGSFAVINGTLMSGTGISGSHATFLTATVDGSVVAAPSFAGLVFHAGLASAGAGSNPTGSLASGTWTALTCSGRLSATAEYNCSSSVHDGRIYVNKNGTYSVVGNVSVESIGSQPPGAWNAHLCIFVTGTEDGQWSTAMDLAKDSSTMLAVNAMPTLVSGNYLEFKIRPSVDIDNLQTHHLQFFINRIGD